MYRKLTSLAAAAVVCMAGLFAPAAAATPVPAAAVPILQDQVVIYEHWDWKGEITPRHNIKTCTAAGDYWHLGPFDLSRISSAVLWVPSGFSRCTRMAVENFQGDWYSECVNQHNWGIERFGEGYNDNTRTVWVGRDPRCPSWNA